MTTWTSVFPSVAMPPQKDAMTQDAAPTHQSTERCTRAQATEALMPELRMLKAKARVRQGCISISTRMVTPPRPLSGHRGAPR
jgi:hypothetical protein